MLSSLENKRIEAIVQLSNKGKYKQALEGINKLLDDKTISSNMQIELVILKSKITLWLGIIDENRLDRKERALNIIDEVIHAEEIQNNQILSFQASALKAKILVSLIRWDEFLVEVEKVENLFHGFEKLDNMQQKIAQANLYQLKGHTPFAKTNAEGIEWDLETSMKYLNNALKIYRELNHYEEIVDIIFEITNNLSLVSHHKDIFNYANEGLRAAEQSENLYLIAFSLHHLSMIYYSKNDYINTLHYSKRSLEIYQKLGDKGGELSSKNILGLYYLKTEMLEEAKKIFQEILNEVPESIAELVNLSMVYVIEGKLIEALKLLNKANELMQEEKHKYLTPYPAFHISRIKIMQGDLDEALIFLKQFLKYTQDRKYKIGISYTLSLIASVYWQKGMNSESIEHATNAVEIIQETESKEWIAYRLFNLINLLFEDSQFEKANIYFTQLQQINSEINLKHINHRIYFLEALFLKSSKNIRDLLKAEFAFEQLLKEDLAYTLRAQVLLNLSELNVVGLENSYDENLLDKIKNNVKLLKELAIKTHSSSFIVQTLLLQAKIAIIDLDFSETQKLMSEALMIAEERGLKSLELLILKEKEELVKKSISLEKVEISQVETAKIEEIHKLNESLKILKRDSFIELKQTEIKESPLFQFKHNI